jgi:y4mF family transcriptional regulator
MKPCHRAFIKVEPVKVNSAHDLAATVRGRRLDLGLSQAKLAELAGVSRVWIATLEGGKRSVNFGLVLRLLFALGLKMDIAPVKNPGDVSKGSSVDPGSYIEGFRN